MATQLLSLNVRERSAPSHRALLIIAGELETTHHRFGVPTSSERERVEFQSVLPGVWCFWRVVGFVHEPAWIAVEPSICFFQTTTAGFNEEVIDERQKRYVDDAIDQVVAPSEMVDAWRSRLDDEVVA
jgi:hypothetical protein